MDLQYSGVGDTPVDIRRPDLPAVLHAATTTPAERKNPLRLVVHEVTVRPIEVPARQVRVQVLSQTGR